MLEDCDEPLEPVFVEAPLLLGSLFIGNIVYETSDACRSPCEQHGKFYGLKICPSIISSFATIIFSRRTCSSLARHAFAVLSSMI